MPLPRKMPRLRAQRFFSLHEPYLRPPSRSVTPVTFRRSPHTSTYEILDGWWTDAGTFESLLRANNLVAKTGANKLKSHSGAKAVAHTEPSQ